MKKVSLMLSASLLIMFGCSSNDSILTVDNMDGMLQSSAEDQDALIAEMPLPEYSMTIEEATEILENAEVYYAKDANTFSIEVADDDLCGEESERVKLEKLMSQYVTLDGYTYNFHLTVDKSNELGIPELDYTDFVEKIEWMNKRIKIIIASGGTIGLKDPQTGDFINVSLSELEENIQEASFGSRSRVSNGMPQPAKGELYSDDYEFNTSPSFTIYLRKEEILFRCKGGREYTCGFYHPALPSWSMRQEMAVDPDEIGVIVETRSVVGSPCVVGFAAYPRGRAQWLEVRGKAYYDGSRLR